MDAQVFTPGVTDVNEYLSKVYRWMAGALGLSALVAWYAASSTAFMELLLANQALFFVIIAAELGLVFYLSFGFNRMSDRTAMISFITYAALTGLTLSTIFMVYTVASIMQTFLATAGTFGALSVYGATTKRDLTAWRSFLFMSLIGLIIASLINLFMASHFLTWVTTYAGIVIFAGLTAYDTQKLKHYAAAGMGAMEKGAIIAALALYLDFINLFMHLLRVMGDRR